MGTKYNHLDFDDRIEISRLHEDGKSPSEIARIMGRHRSTISRELKRNGLLSGYKPARAERMAWVRCGRLSRLERLSQLGGLVRDRLAMGWSPEQIAGRLRHEGAEHMISHESIYRFIYRPKIRSERLHRYLPRAKACRGRRYFKRRREPMAARHSIHERPQGAQTRHQFGHWEADLMQFRTQRGNLLTLCERKTRFTITAPLRTKTAAETGDVLRAIFRKMPEPLKRSVTFDNGGEFAEYKTLGMDTFFCDPSAPWQRGTIENTNGIIRRDMPRKTDISNYTLSDIDQLTWAINSTPRKCLGFKTPAEAFLENIHGALEM